VLRPRQLLPLLGALLGASAACCDRARDTVSSSSSGAWSASGRGGEASGSEGTGPGTTSVARCNRGPSSQICNPFGAELRAPNLSRDTYWGLLTDVFKVHFYRPATLFLDQLAKDPAVCVECDTGASKGLYLVLVVRSNGGPLTPTKPPSSLDAYKTALGEVIDRYHGALAVVVIEDEMNSSTSYEGSAADYIAELKAGCEVAHAKGVRCADGGLGSTSLLYLLADYYRGLGGTQGSLRILEAAKSNPSVPQVFKDGQATDQDVAALLLTRKDEIDEAKELLLGFRDAGVDYVNFHWYEEGPDTLDEIIAFMRMTTGCNAVITDELGQRVQDEADAMYKLTDARELGLPFVIWSSRDTENSALLVDAEGNLLPSGMALKKRSTTTTCGD
jgi:hypothetical protein